LIRPKTPEGMNWLTLKDEAGGSGGERADLSEAIVGLPHADNGRMLDHGRKLPSSVTS
jgi:hypothetical protein